MGLGLCLVLEGCEGRREVREDRMVVGGFYFLRGNERLIIFKFTISISFRS